MHPLAQQPLILIPRRVERLYTGGRLLDRWQRLPESGDSHQSECFLVSDMPYIGGQLGLPAEGMNCVSMPGSEVTLRQLCAAAPQEFLGSRARPGAHSGVQARACDSNIRLVLQIHPDGEAAARYFGSPCGKTEAWYIFGVRKELSPCIYAGFKPGVSAEQWHELFCRQDVNGMLACLHRVEVELGDTIVIPAGMPHALGPGCLALEISEPCDYTLRFEKNYAVRSLSDNEMHAGLGFQALFALIHHDNYTREALLQKIKPKRQLAVSDAGGTLEHLLTSADTGCFSADRLSLSGRYTSPDFPWHRIVIAIKGDTVLSCEGGAATLPQGWGAFIPAQVRSLALEGDGEAVIGYP